MRRPSILFEAIGLHSRLRGAGLSVHFAPQKEATMAPTPDENHEPAPVPTDPVETPKPASDDLEDTEDDGDDDSTGFDDDDE